MTVGGDWYHHYSNAQPWELGKIGRHQSPYPQEHIMKIYLMMLLFFLFN